MVTYTRDKLHRCYNIIWRALIHRLICDRTVSSTVVTAKGQSTRQITMLFCSGVGYSGHSLWLTGAHICHICREQRSALFPVTGPDCCSNVINLNIIELEDSILATSLKLTGAEAYTPLGYE